MGPSFDPVVDPVVFGALAAKLQAVAVQMSFALKRTSRSLYVKDGEDFCASIMGLDGLLLTAPDTVGSTLLTLVDATEAIAAVPDLAPGDVIIANDAHTSGALSTHLADLHVIEPYYVEGELVGYGWAFVHSSDIGGRVPSSISPFNTDVYQEGLQLPPVRLVKGGEIDDEIEALIRRNSRTPDANSADIRAMLAALRLGHRAVTDLVAEYGSHTFLAAQRDILGYSERRARDIFTSLPPGRHRFSDYLDDDALSPYPVRYAVALEVDEAGGLTVDFTGTDPQVSSAFNIVSKGRPHPMLTGRVRSSLVTLDPAFPNDAGQVRAVTVIAPEGTIVNAVHPAAVGVRHGSAVRVSDALGGAFLAMAPQVMPAAGSGVVVPVVVSQRRGHARGSQVLTRLFGGFGAANGLDGHDGKDNGYSNLASSPVETAEAELRLTVLDYSLRPDSGGPGRWRGGVGRQLTFRVDEDGTQVLARGLERFVFRPWGANGGRPGAPTEVIVNAGRSVEQRHRKIDVLYLDAGDTITFRTPGGGGFGDPFLREPASVLSDVRRGLVGWESARRDYGVALGGGPGTETIDEAATARARAGHVVVAGGIDVGVERRRWATVFTEDWHDRFAAALLANGVGQSPRLRDGLYDSVFGLLPADFPVAEASAEQLATAGAEAERLLVELESRSARSG
ncbi:MAG TPA: hydantoinase B/oxoprolinase family protein [Lacisediminihabitans sp.]|uniref:hydantoinase B/oxoprolinase family protein n=1 Tax=Lacisediminihabitans sp. TaxID=2787631 RepID=UPI002EDB896D